MTLNEFMTWLQRYVNEGCGNKPVVFAWGSHELTFDATGSEFVDGTLVLELDKGE